MLRCTALAFISMFAFASMFGSDALAQPVLTTTPAVAHPGDTVTWSVSNGTPDDNVYVLAALRRSGSVYTAGYTCNGNPASVNVNMDIGPGLRQVGVGRIAADGTFVVMGRVPRGISPSLNGRMVFSQAVVVPDRRRPPCGSTPQKTNVTTQPTLAVP